MLFIAAAVFGLVFVLGLGFYTDSLGRYQVTADNSSFGLITQNFQELNEQSNDVKDKIQTQPVEDEDAVDAIVSGSYKAIKNNVFDSLAIGVNASKMFMKESDLVPGPVMIFLVLALSIITGFSILYLIFRFKAG